MKYDLPIFDRRGAIVMSAIVAVLAVSAIVMHRRLDGARQDMAAAQAEFGFVASHAREVVALRGEGGIMSVGKRPTQDLVARLNRALADAGLSPPTLGEIRNDFDAAVDAGVADGPRIRRQSMTVSLRDLTIADLGRFLGAWTSSRDVWAVSQISLSHQRGRAPTEGRYDIHMALHALYMGELP